MLLDPRLLIPDPRYRELGALPVMYIIICRVIVLCHVIL